MSSEGSSATIKPDLKARRHGSAVFASDLRRACDLCRQGKLRCDGAQPCARCKKHNRDCVYLQAPKKRGRRAGSNNPAHANSLPIQKTHLDPSAGTTPSQNSENSEDAVIFGLEFLDQLPLNATASLPQRHGKSAPSAIQPLMFDGESHATTAEPWLPGLTTDLPNGTLPLPADLPTPLATQLPPSLFLPYVRLFFEHLHPIMPVLDRDVYLNSGLLNQPVLSTDDYQLLSALAAMTVVQLGLYSTTSGISEPLHGTDLTLSGSFLVNECLESRRLVPEFISTATTASVVTSFFLFSYYGNLDQHAKAWYYLREAITFAQLLGLEDEEALPTVDEIDQVSIERRRRLFWLLFITERAYALQRRLRTTLRPTVPTPVIFESEDPQLLYGFVSLANVYRSVDELFVELWMGKPKETGVSVKPWLVDFHHSLDTSYTSMGVSHETHEFDIAVSRHWLHLLAWQLSVKQNYLSSQSNERVLKLDYPVHIAQGLLQITSSAKQEVLDAHGIGIEQKLTDTADCIINVLQHSKGTHTAIFSRGRDTLQGLLQRLGHMRGSQSRYLPVLVSKMNDFLDDIFSPYSPVSLMLTSPAYMPWARLMEESRRVEAEAYVDAVEFEGFRITEMDEMENPTF